MAFIKPASWLPTTSLRLGAERQGREGLAAGSSRAVAFLGGGGHVVKRGQDLEALMTPTARGRDRRGQ